MLDEEFLEKRSRGRAYGAAADNASNRKLSETTIYLIKRQESPAKKMVVVKKGTAKEVRKYR